MKLLNTNQDRYYKLNLASYFRHGTVEFRQHSGTVEARKMIPWIKFCIAFVENSKVEEELSDERKNAMSKKLLQLATFLDNNTSVYPSSGASAEAIADAIDVQPGTVITYISILRKRYGLEIENKRGQSPRGGVFYKGTNESLVARMGFVVQQPTVFVEKGLFGGLEAEVVSYFQEREIDLQ